MKISFLSTTNKFVFVEFKNGVFFSFLLFMPEFSMRGNALVPMDRRDSMFPSCQISLFHRVTQQSSRMHGISQTCMLNLWGFFMLNNDHQSLPISLYLSFIYHHQPPSFELPLKQNYNCVVCFPVFTKQKYFFLNQQKVPHMVTKHHVTKRILKD